MIDSTFCTSIHCMDGRVQEPVIRFLKTRFKITFVDAVTLPGPERILGAEGEDSTETDRIRHFVSISVDQHGSELIAVFAHHDCAGNPVNRKVKIQQVKKSVRRIRTWFDRVTVQGFYINENWNVEWIEV